LKTSFDSREALEPDGRHPAPVMTVMLSMSGVIAEHTTVIPRIDRRINVGQVVPDNPAGSVNPNLPAQHSTSLGAGQVKAFVNGFSQWHQT
jgi:hypothetical protein